MKGLRILQRLVKRVVLISLGACSSCSPAYPRSAAREGEQISIYINGSAGNDNNKKTQKTLAFSVRSKRGESLGQKGFENTLTAPDGICVAISCPW